MYVSELIVGAVLGTVFWFLVAVFVTVIKKERQ